MRSSKTAKRSLILIVIFIAVGYALYNGFFKDKAVVQTGGAAPDFVLKTLSGESIQLSQFKGKGVVLNFWGTWCPPCREEMPAIEKTWSALKNKGIVVIGVNIGESEVAVGGFKEQYHLTFPIVLDKKKEITQLYGIDPIPTTYFIDKNGIVQKIIIAPMDEQTILKNMEQIAP